MDSNSSPGVDGFYAGFFKSAWSIVEGDFCRAVQNFFRTGKMTKQANSTIISLIPKKDIPRSVMDFRYPVEFGFPQQFIKWVLGCITGTWYSLKLNGGLFGFFPGKDGTRQGDPLSPYTQHRDLVQILKTLMSGAFDDLMVFVRGDVPSVRVVQHALTNFASISGLNTNVEKTSIYFGGVSQEQKLQHWSAKYITYACKAQLLYAVIFGLENFWCSSVLLPQEGEDLIQACADLECSFAASLDFEVIYYFYRTVGKMAQRVAVGLFDSWVKGGKLQTSGIYEYLLEAPIQEDWYLVLFHTSIVPSHQFIAILAAQGKLATVDNLQIRGFQLVNRCSICKQALESHQHLFFRCSFSQAVWAELQHWQQLIERSSDLIEGMQWSYTSGSQVGWAAA
ncbi:uncharacterized protein LOC141618570 [Silene latifolia]|uniref:uncharacterized protein LOC141618570 n=1 Tax=Silene latifolia TaxID=37657 RepID=UPI003D77A82C